MRIKSSHAEAAARSSWFNAQGGWKGKELHVLKILTASWFQPLWKIWGSQLGLWNSRYMEKWWTIENVPSHQPANFSEVQWRNIAFLSRPYRSSPSSTTWKPCFNYGRVGLQGASEETFSLERWAKGQEFHEVRDANIIIILNHWNFMIMDVSGGSGISYLWNSMNFY